MVADRVPEYLLRGSRRALAPALATLVLFAVVGCGAIGSPPAGNDSSTGLSQSSTSPSQGLVPATQANTPTPGSTAAPQQDVTQEEAQAVVHAYFDALAAEDFQQAEKLTAGEANRQTREISESVQQETAERGLDADIVVNRLEMNPDPIQPATGQSVRASFGAEINAVAGSFSVQAHQIDGEATFVVQRVDGETRITDVQDISGLPLPTTVPTARIP